MDYNYPGIFQEVFGAKTSGPFGRHSTSRSFDMTFDLFMMVLDQILIWLPESILMIYFLIGLVEIAFMGLFIITLCMQHQFRLSTFFAPL